ncbi:30S ribosomal protein S9, chloroplastic-like [Durio zibethinus]|uniref:30S ribosomal protein S9, chloroplastic-like n=1 Tax=Durio zibethinus TaxID=66656 RepID=A0A6P6ANV3_DURZI|nr:30S ribosomal protein S9, chloroplastic-like [Durio zibethinus]
MGRRKYINKIDILPNPRVVLQGGTRKFIINYRDAKECLQGNPLWLQYIKVPLVTLRYETSYDIFVKAHGGGLSG